MRQFITILTVALVSGQSILAADSSSASKSVKSAAQAAKTACSADVKKYCGDVSPGEGHIASCLKSKEDQLSDQCNKARQDLSALVSEKVDKAKVAFQKSCGSDVQKFC